MTKSSKHSEKKVKESKKEKETEPISINSEESNDSESEEKKDKKEKPKKKDNSKAKDKSKKKNDKKVVKEVKEIKEEPAPPKREKKRRAKKDKAAPKRQTTAFLFYQSDRRPILKKEQPNLSSKEILIKMSKEWKKMKDDDKMKYILLAEADRKRFLREHAIYENNKSVEKSTKYGTGRKKGAYCYRKNELKPEYKQQIEELKK